MSITHDDLYKLGQSLESDDSELAWRASTSRTYYAAYHRGLESVIHCPDNSNQKMGSHERLTNRFDLHGAKGARAISYVLLAMKRVRHIADYEIADHFDKGLATTQLSQYKTLVDRFNSFDKECSK